MDTNLNDPDLSTESYMEVLHWELGGQAGRQTIEAQVILRAQRQGSMGKELLISVPSL